MQQDFKSAIELKVIMDKNRVPEKLHWSAKEENIDNQEAKAAFLSIWDGNARESLRIDLWTKDMPLEDMKLFFYETLVSMSDTFLKATNDQKMSETMKDFCDYFAEKMNLKRS